ncbi:MAG: hypothetical protein HRU48_21275 [Vibrio sp.]|uniref:hypothetical protein n=1 Tax=Vibrio TaxID=662 RepID=UPI001EC9627B|nr:hypothetical protein [Vibrio sp.]NRB69858.1 hypothetical protein [Vibrio sp.]
MKNGPVDRKGLSFTPFITTISHHRAILISVIGLQAHLIVLVADLISTKRI